MEIGEIAALTTFNFELANTVTTRRILGLRIKLLILDATDRKTRSLAAVAPVDDPAIVGQAPGPSVIRIVLVFCRTPPVAVEIGRASCRERV